ncbi:hypothetical protein M404DRAFT_266097 [Pisolithus tinctorius Marx 270]|uniref:Uncharacterized protein n=1 Tax=Pisolithus tinctorius Marx 270 TaxID=870435 RepID=A0A0C3P7P5_PISTI|nr:hypothetical protein M404DRAFT_266097 [Pisolithus tinctorius Marx 270]
MYQIFHGTTGLRKHQGFLASVVIIQILIEFIPEFPGKVACLAKKQTLHCHSRPVSWQSLSPRFSLDSCSTCSARV